MKKKLFGTDGIRGIAGEYPLNDDTIKKIAYAASGILSKNYNDKSTKRVIIGGDTRSSRGHIFDALCSGFMSGGFTIHNAGVAPTPAISFLVKQLGCICGVVISASHNTWEYNGIKFFSGSGEKLPDNLEYEIEQEFYKTSDIPNVDDEYRLGFDHTNTGPIKASEEYKKFLLSTVPKEFNLKGMKVVIDCANGALYKIAPNFFQELGADVIAINCKPNGKNINADCGSLHKEDIMRSVRENNADLGFAFDGDGDRVLFTDEKGSDLDGDHLMAIAAVSLKEQGRLKNNTLIITIMTNLGLKLAMNDMGIKTIETGVGDRYVYEAMKTNDLNLGGEQSGHIIFRDYSVTGDGMLTALQILRIVKEKGKRLSELGGIIKKLPQILINVKVREKKDIMAIPKLKERYNTIKNSLGSEGRINVRYSGTEPLLRVMIEGRNKEEIEDMAGGYAELIKKELE
ncbi:MAG: phosphoglucosamine mutase [Elusimicrobiota bacterium]